MSRIRVAAAVAAVLFWAVTPVLACLMPCLAPTPAAGCSHTMAMHCGHLTMSAGGNCCQMSVRSQMATVEKELNSSQKHPLAAVAAVEAESLSNVSAIHAVRIAFFESPPAQAPPPVSSILRI